MSLRSISAVAGSIAAAVLLHLAWFLLPWESGLAVGHAILAALAAATVLGHAVRLESLNFHDPQPSHTTGPAVLSFGIVLAFDAAHAALVGLVAVSQLEWTLFAGILTALLAHVACETVVAVQSIAPAVAVGTPTRTGRRPNRTASKQ